jgi:hypothetical protein
MRQERGGERESIGPMLNVRVSRRLPADSPTVPYECNAQRYSVERGSSRWRCGKWLKGCVLWNNHFLPGTE